MLPSCEIKNGQVLLLQAKRVSGPERRARCSLGSQKWLLAPGDRGRTWVTYIPPPLAQRRRSQIGTCLPSLAQVPLVKVDTSPVTQNSQGLVWVPWEWLFPRSPWAPKQSSPRSWARSLRQCAMCVGHWGQDFQESGGAELGQPSLASPSPNTRRTWTYPISLPEGGHTPILFWFIQPVSLYVICSPAHIWMIVKDIRK